MASDRPGAGFVAEMESVQHTYLAKTDPMEQSGFSGGRERWIAERSPLLEAIDHDGDLLDVGCANGLLLEDIVQWAVGLGYTITPHGVDSSPGLVELARRRLPGSIGDLVTADAWTWRPDRAWDYVFSLIDLAPPDLTCAWLQRLATWVAPGGRLIIGSYGSRSRRIEPADVAVALERCGYPVHGRSAAGEPVTSRFAWTAI